MARRIRRVEVGLNYKGVGGLGLYAYRQNAETDRFINELDPGNDDALLRSSHCINFDGVTYLSFENALPSGSYIDTSGGTSILSLHIPDKKITATIGTAWNIVIKEADGSVWAELPCAEGSGVTCFDVSGNGNHGYCSSYTSLTSFRGADQHTYHYNLRNGYSRIYYVPFLDRVKSRVSGVNWNKNMTVVFSGKKIRSNNFTAGYFVSNSIIRVNLSTNPVKIDLYGNEFGGVEQNYQYNFNMSIAESWGCFFVMTIQWVNNYSYEVSVYNRTGSQKITTTHNLRAMNQSNNTALFFTTGAASNDGVEGLVFSSCVWKRVLSGAEIASILEQEDRQYLNFSGMDLTGMVMKVEDGVFSYNGTLQSGVGGMTKVPAVGSKDVMGYAVRRSSGAWHNGCETKLLSSGLGLYRYGDEMENPKFKKAEKAKESRYLVFDSVVSGKLLDYVNEFES